MPGSAARRGLWTLGAAIVVVVLVVAALPLVASTQIVRDRIAQQMSVWSGYRVQLREAPEIQVWPSFQAVLHNVTFSEWGNAEARPIVDAERIEVNLSALAALRGDVVFTNIRMIRPVMRVSDSRGPLPLPTAPIGGRLMHAVNAARELLAANPDKPDTASLPSDPFGTVEVQDGRLVREDGGGGREIVTGLTATVSWPALNRPASLTANGIWHGENVEMEAKIAEPLILLADGTAPLTASLKAAPANAAFNGVANISEKSFINGDLTLSSPSIKRMLEWTHSQIAPGEAIGSIELGGKVSGNTDRLKLDEAEIKLDDNPGVGALDMAFDQTTPRITGTLAFQTIDMQSFLSAFTPLPAVPTAAEAPLELTFSNDFNLDLRLSAPSATIGTLSLSDVAATAQVQDGLAAFDISDATAFGGTVQFGMRMDREIGQDLFELRATADDIEGGQLAARLHMERLVPRARGSLSIILKGNGASWDGILENAEGSFTANFGPGTLQGFNLEDFVESNARGGFFPLSEAQEGALPIDGIDIKATLSKGIARIDKAEVKAHDSVIALSGLIPLAGRGIALSGTIAPPPEEDASDGRRAAFFVGGSWNAPFISPALPGLPPG